MAGWSGHASSTDDVAVQDKSHVEARNGYIYLYHNYNETVFDTSGKYCYSPSRIYRTLYRWTRTDICTAVQAMKAYLMPSWNLCATASYFDYRTPSNVIEKFSPDGKPEWRKELDENVSEPYYLPAVWNEEIGLPLYWNGTLYVPLDKGVIALNKDGDVLWTKTFDKIIRYSTLCQRTRG